MSARFAFWGVAVFAVLHLVVAARAGLVPDEAYYWLWSQNPSAGYYDHPPMVAFWIAAGTRLFGDGALPIRLISVLTVPFVSLVLYSTGRMLFGTEAIAARAVVWFNCTLLVALAGFMALPDAPSLAFWSLTVYALAKLIKTDDSRWWLAVGLFAGLGLVSKYTNFFLGVGIVLWLLADKPSRRWLKTVWPYAGGVIALLVFLPVLIWNANHDWASFGKQFGRIESKGLRPGFLLDFIVTQFLFLNPFIAALAATAIVRQFRRPEVWSRETGLLTLVVAPLVLYMAMHALHAQVQANWLVPIYPALALLASAVAEGFLPRVLRWFRQAVVPFGLACAAVGLFIIAAPVESVLMRIASPRFVGWDVLAAEVERQMAATGATWVATTMYSSNSELVLHLPTVPVFQVNERIRYAFQPEPALPEGPAILVGNPLHLGADTCFWKITPLSLFTPPGLRLGKGYSLNLAEGPAPDLLKNGCTIEKDE
jgi:4-amino-4-deoxy-L-arabinose transferase-like glycosyltransferase